MESKYIVDDFGLPLEKSCIHVLWEDRDETYRGRVYSRKGLNVVIHYDDGDVQRHNLNDITWKLNNRNNNKWNEPGDANELIQDNKDKTFRVSSDQPPPLKVKPNPSASAAKKNKRRSVPKGGRRRVKKRSLPQSETSSSTVSSCSFSNVRPRRASKSPSDDESDAKKSVDEGSGMRRRKRLRTLSAASVHYNESDENEGEADGLVSFLGEQIEADDEDEEPTTPTISNTTPSLTPSHTPTTSTAKPATTDSDLRSDEELTKKRKLSASAEDDHQEEAKQAKENKLPNSPASDCTVPSPPPGAMSHSLVSRDDIDMLLQLSSHHQQQTTIPHAFQLPLFTHPVPPTVSPGVVDEQDAEPETPRRKKIRLQDLLN